MKDLGKRPQLIRNCRLNDNGLLLMPEGVMKLRGSGLEILRLCDGQRTIADIVALLKQKFPQTAADKITADSLHFLKQLQEKRVMDFV